MGRDRKVALASDGKLDLVGEIKPVPSRSDSAKGEFDHRHSSHAICQCGHVHATQPLAFLSDDSAAARNQRQGSAQSIPSSVKVSTVTERHVWRARRIARVDDLPGTILIPVFDR